MSTLPRTTLILLRLSPMSRARLVQGNPRTVRARRLSTDQHAGRGGHDSLAYRGGAGCCAWCSRIVAALHRRVRGPLGHAVFSDPDFAERFREVAENAPTWRNQVTPRFLFTAPRYRDGTMERIAVPLMVMVARDDAVISSAFVKEKAARAPQHEIREYPVGHFERYHGAVRDQVAGDQVAFLQRHLMSTPH